MAVTAAGATYVAPATIFIKRKYEKSDIFAVIVDHIAKIIARNKQLIVIHAAVRAEGNLACQTRAYKPFGLAAEIGVTCKKYFSAKTQNFACSLCACSGIKLCISNKICAGQFGILWPVYESFNLCRYGLWYPIVVLFLRGKKSCAALHRRRSCI